MRDLLGAQHILDLKGLGVVVDYPITASASSLLKSPISI